VVANGLDLDRISLSEIIFSSPLAALLACSRRLSASSSFCLQPIPNRYKRERQAIAKGKPEAAAFLPHSNAFFQRPKTGLEPSRVVLYAFAQHSVVQGDPLERHGGRHDAPSLASRHRLQTLGT
jgi:hypothetical protein